MWLNFLRIIGIMHEKCTKTFNYTISSNCYRNRNLFFSKLISYLKYSLNLLNSILYLQINVILKGMQQFLLTQWIKRRNSFVKMPVFCTLEL